MTEPRQPGDTADTPVDPEPATDAMTVPLGPPSDAETTEVFAAIGPESDTDAESESPDDAAPDDAAPDEGGEPEFEGPRRRERRERAERREAQERARAIEEARREAKRRARNPQAADGDKRGSVRGLKLVLSTLLALLVAVALSLTLYLTPLMSARKVLVLGTGEVTEAEVLDAARVQLGTPLLQIDTDAIADRVATIRKVASARVQREYPSTLRITIAERIPVAVKDFPDGPRLYDRDGVDFTGVAPPALPYLDVDNPTPNDPPTKAALEVLTSLRPEVAAQVGRVAAPSVASITLTLTDGRVVVWGTNDRTEEKAEKLGALLTQPGRTYDVSSPDLPTVK